LDPACDAVFSEYPAAIAASRFDAPDSKASANRRFLSVNAMFNFSVKGEKIYEWGGRGFRAWKIWNF
jgi:hypothetical protein